MASMEITDDTVSYRNIDAFRVLYSMECAMVGDIESLTIDEIEHYVCQLKAHTVLVLQTD